MPVLYTGLKCPGCGFQRAIHSLLHLDFVIDFRFNALLVSSLPVVIVLEYAELERCPNESEQREVYVGLFYC